MRKTKIICTLGPANDDIGVLEEMIKAGMNVARLNFSHGTHEEHKVRADNIKMLRRKLRAPVAIMIDTKGPDIRVGRFEENFVELQSGHDFTLTTDGSLGDIHHASVTYPALPEKLRPGDVILLDDGLISMTVSSIEPGAIHCRVNIGGVLANNKSVSIPGKTLNMPYMRENDVSDIKFAIENDFDYIAASFVRNAQDVLSIREILDEMHADTIKIISKIENSEGVENIDEILAVSDGIMVARGDMGVEIDFEEIPSIQKMLIKRANMAGKIVVTATQMLESMIQNPRPTRAEISDVANAIYDGSCAIMLSGETAVGKYPVETIRAMCRIAERTEEDIDYAGRFNRFHHEGCSDITAAISYASVSTSFVLSTKAILCPTQTGYTAGAIARCRPLAPIIACTPVEKVYHQLSLQWGTYPVLFQTVKDNVYGAAMAAAKESGYVNTGDLAVITAGLPLGVAGKSNTIRVSVVE